MHFSRVKGITLVEVLIAVGILGVTLSGVLLVFVRCSLINQGSRSLTVAATHAQFVVEDIRSADFDSLPAKIAQGMWDWDSADIEAKEITPLNNEIINTECKGCAEPPEEEDLLHIIVTVSWQNLDQRDRDFTLETLIGKQ